MFRHRNCCAPAPGCTPTVEPGPAVSDTKPASRETLRSPLAYDNFLQRVPDRKLTPAEHDAIKQQHLQRMLGSKSFAEVEPQIRQSLLAYKWGANEEIGLRVDKRPAEHAEQFNQKVTFSVPAGGTTPNFEIVHFYQSPTYHYDRNCQPQLASSSLAVTGYGYGTRTDGLVSISCEEMFITVERKDGRDHYTAHMRHNFIGALKITANSTSYYVLTHGQEDGAGGGQGTGRGTDAEKGAPAKSSSAPGPSTENKPDTAAGERKPGTGAARAGKPMGKGPVVSPEATGGTPGPGYTQKPEHESAPTGGQVEANLTGRGAAPKTEKAKGGGSSVEPEKKQGTPGPGYTQKPEHESAPQGGQVEANLTGGGAAPKTEKAKGSGSSVEPEKKQGTPGPGYTQKPEHESAPTGGQVEANLTGGGAAPKSEKAKGGSSVEPEKKQGTPGPGYTQKPEHESAPTGGQVEANLTGGGAAPKSEKAKGGSSVEPEKKQGTPGPGYTQKPEHESAPTGGQAEANLTGGGAAPKTEKAKGGSSVEPEKKQGTPGPGYTQKPEHESAPTGGQVEANLTGGGAAPKTEKAKGGSSVEPEKKQGTPGPGYTQKPEKESAPTGGQVEANLTGGGAAPKTEKAKGGSSVEPEKKQGTAGPGYTQKPEHESAPTGGQVEANLTGGGAAPRTPQPATRAVPGKEDVAATAGPNYNAPAGKEAAPKQNAAPTGLAEGKQTREPEESLLSGLSVPPRTKHGDDEYEEPDFRLNPFPRNTGRTGTKPTEAEKVAAALDFCAWALDQQQRQEKTIPEARIPAKEIHAVCAALPAMITDNPPSFGTTEGQKRKEALEQRVGEAGNLQWKIGEQKKSLLDYMSKNSGKLNREEERSLAGTIDRLELFEDMLYAIALFYNEQVQLIYGNVYRRDQLEDPKNYSDSTTQLQDNLRSLFSPRPGQQHYNAAMKQQRELRTLKPDDLKTPADRGLFAKDLAAEQLDAGTAALQAFAAEPLKPQSFADLSAMERMLANAHQAVQNPAFTKQVDKRKEKSVRDKLEELAHLRGKKPAAPDEVFPPPTVSMEQYLREIMGHDRYRNCGACHLLDVIDQDPRSRPFVVDQLTSLLREDLSRETKQQCEKLQKALVQANQRIEEAKLAEYERQTNDAYFEFSRLFSYNGTDLSCSNPTDAAEKAVAALQAIDKELAYIASMQNHGSRQASTDTLLRLKRQNIAYVVQNKYPQLASANPRLNNLLKHELPKPGKTTRPDASFMDNPEGALDLLDLVPKQQ